MRSHIQLRLSGALAIALLAATAIEAGAADSRTYTFTRPGAIAALSNGGPHIEGPGGATRMRVVMSETGLVPQFAVLSNGSLTAKLVTNAAGCGGTPTLSVTADTLMVNWGSACVLPGNAVSIHFTTAKGPLGVRRSYYTDGLGDSIAPAIPSPTVPGVSPLAAMMLTALLALAGVVVVARRRRTAAEA